MISTKKFERFLDKLCERLTMESQRKIFPSASAFEHRVRETLGDILSKTQHVIDFQPKPQAFPDIAVGCFGAEVKFTLEDTWRSVANSVLETNRIDSVKKIYVVFGKMGGIPEVRWGEYEQSVIHVRTSHVPRFEVEMTRSQPSLFQRMGVNYDTFRTLPMEEKMKHIRSYSRSKLRTGERLWWLEDASEAAGDRTSPPLHPRLYTSLGAQGKTRMRAEVALLFPNIVKPGRTRNKYDDIVLYLATQHGGVCHQARDLFSVGRTPRTPNPEKKSAGVPSIAKSLKRIEEAMKTAALEMDDALFVKYWGESIPPQERISQWLAKADSLAQDWTPSKFLFGAR